MLFLSISNISKSNELSTTDGSIISFVKNSDENYPLALIINSEEKNTLIDRYSFEGGEPNVVNSSFLKIDNKTFFLVLISWNVNHYDIKGTQYQTFIYNYKNKKLHKYLKLNDDSNLSGFIGYTSDSTNQKYDYNNIKSVKTYLQDKLNSGKINLFSCILHNKKTVIINHQNNKNNYIYKNNDNVELKYPHSNESPISFDNENNIIYFNRGNYTYSITKGKANDYALSIKNNDKIIFNKSCKNILTTFPSNINEYFN